VIEQIFPSSSTLSSSELLARSEATIPRLIATLVGFIRGAAMISLPAIKLVGTTSTLSLYSAFEVGVIANVGFPSPAITPQPFHKACVALRTLVHLSHV
jgi:hypothetical protein